MNTDDKLLFASDYVFAIGDRRRVDAAIKFEVRDFQDPRLSLAHLAPLRNFVAEWGLELRQDNIIEHIDHDWQGQADLFVFADPSILDDDLPPIMEVGSLTPAERAEIHSRITAELQELSEQALKCVT